MPSLWEVSEYIRKEADRCLPQLENSSVDFARVSNEILQSAPYEEFGFEDICDQRLWREQNQNHKKATFSDASLTLWRRPTYFLDYYIWVDRHTSIHDHNFAGAFRVMKGLYAQVSYQFNIKKEVAPGIQTGDLITVRASNLQHGDSHSILDGEGNFIHQVLHAEVPCVTLCLRSPNTTPYLYSYLSNGWKVSMNRPDAEFNQMLTCIRLFTKQNLWAEARKHLNKIPFNLAISFTIQEPSFLYLNPTWWEILLDRFPERSEVLKELLSALYQENIHNQKLLYLLR